MGIWSREPKSEYERMRDRLKQLEDRVIQLEADCAPFRIGELHNMYLYGPGWQDPRPKVSLRQAAEKIMAHCGLSFDRIPPVAEQIVVKDRKTEQPFIQSGEGALNRTATSRKRRS